MMVHLLLYDGSLESALKIQIEVRNQCVNPYHQKRSTEMNQTPVLVMPISSY